MYKEVHNTFPLLREAAIKSGIGLMELALRQRDEADGGGDRGAREQMLGEAQWNGVLWRSICSPRCHLAASLRCHPASDRPPRPTAGTCAVVMVCLLF